MCDANGREPEDRAEMKRQTGAARVIASRGVDQEHVGHLWEGSDYSFQERPLPQRQQAGLIRMTG